MGPALILGHARPPRGYPALPRPTSLAALTVAVTQPGLETIFWGASVWGGLGLQRPPVRGAGALEGTVPSPGGGG